MRMRLQLTRLVMAQLLQLPPPLLQEIKPTLLLQLARVTLLPLILQPQQLPRLIQSQIQMMMTALQMGMINLLQQLPIAQAKRLRLSVPKLLMIQQVIVTINSLIQRVT